MKILLNELNIYEVENCHKKILKEVQSVKSSFTLNFSNVEKIDLNSIQLILSLKKYCDEKAIHLKLTNIEARQVKQTFKMFNLNQTLGIAP
ncbi:MAG: STAS domain-containing protein [gamma proteobacterium symbiont of Taylorina sp.]|nr:STAS domain-containing protein [gamma proteobacterium symbiont of Taylorina sp.]